MPQKNAGAWLEANQQPLVVKETPYTPPGPDQLVVRVRAVAMNPIDRMKQQLGSFLYGHVKLPFILGYDLAGEVYEVGSGVTRFKSGDRVLALAIGMEKSVNTSVESAFQHYAIVRGCSTSEIPNDISFEQAAVVPLGLATAATGLFKKDRLGLELPTSPKRAPIGKTVLIWGGSTSVGLNAIQLAVAAGYDVFTTCSPRNFDMVRRLGATQAFDYNSKTVVNDIITAFDARICAGALAIGSGSADHCMNILYRCKGKRFIASASFPVPDPLPQTFTLPRLIFSVLTWFIVNSIKSTLRSTKTSFFTATELLGHEIETEIFERFLPAALARAEYVCAPNAEVIGAGLEHIQEAFDTLGKGVSAKKIVVTLP